MRHAKSGWEDESLPDHERPLTERGKRDAEEVGKMLRRTGRVPHLVISSTARRARKTAQRVARHASYENSVLLYPELYSAPVEQIVEVLRGAPGEPQTLLVVGHNPGLQEFTSQLAGQSLDMPTAALADFELGIDQWSAFTLATAAKFNGIWTPGSEEPGGSN